MVLLDKITAESAKSAIKSIQKANVYDEHWREVLINHIKTCMAIVNLDVDEFKVLFNSNEHSRYFDFNAPTIEQSGGVSRQLENNPLDFGKVYIDFVPAISQININPFEVSIFHLLHEQSKNVVLNSVEWNFSKTVCDYVYKLYTPYFLNRFENCLNFSDSNVRVLLENFKAYWQHNVHMLDGLSDVLNYDLMKQKYLFFVENLLELHPNIQKSSLYLLKNSDETLYIRSPETFKLVSQDLSPFSLFVKFPRFNDINPGVFFRNANYIFKKITDKEASNVLGVQFNNIFISLTQAFRNKRNLEVLSYEDWKKLLIDCKSEERDDFIEFLGLVNGVLEKRMRAKGELSFKIEFAALFFWSYLYKDALLNKKSSIVKEINSYRETIYYEIENDTAALSSFINFCKFMKMEESFYLPIENKIIVESILKKEDNEEDFLCDENRDFKI